MQKLILFEVNEVPKKIYDYYTANNPHTILSKILKASKQYVTVSTDKGELHPWSTWPTLHRGVDNTKHHIKDIGEDLALTNKKYPPVWDILVNKNISTGVFSSLHTYPLPSDYKKYDFLVPDPFANGKESYPSSIEPFQSFNLAMTKKSGRSVDTGIDKSAALNLVLALPKIGLRLSTLFATGKQLADEKINPWKAVRRRAFQSVLAFDIYLKLLKQNKPTFTTFFSNHVASAMHRYWAATFPEDYEINNLSKEWINRYKNEIPYCMDQLNRMITEIYQFIRRNPEYKLIIASSMGQAPTTAEQINQELFLNDYSTFIKNLGDVKFEKLSAMHPQYNINVDSNQSDLFESKLSKLIINGQPIRYRRKNGNFFSIDFGYPDIEKFEINIEEKVFTLSELGLEIRKIDDQSGGTAYHIPEGAFFIYDHMNEDNSGEIQNIDLREVAPAILNYFEIEAADYMLKPGFSI